MNNNCSPFQEEIDALEKEGVFPIECIPDTGFLNSYLKYSCRMSDAPLLFNMFSAFSVMATCLSNVFYQFGYSKKRLNLWIIITAPTATFRKSTSTKTATHILRMASPNKDHTFFFPTDFSVEKILMEIAEKKEGLFAWDEFGGVMARFSKSYMNGAKEVFTELFENAYFKRKLKKDEDVVIDNPYINILSSTTFEWFENKVMAEDIEGGWLNRFIYVYVKKKIRTWAMPLFDSDPCEQIFLRDKLAEFRLKKGELYFSDKAREIYSKFYSNFENQLNDRESRVKNLYIRLPLYCLKFACLYTINEDINASIVSEDNMRKAILLSEWLLNCSYEETSERFLTDNFYRINRLIYNRVKRCGKKGIKREKLYLLSHLNARVLDEHLKTLVESGEIRGENILAKDTNRERWQYFIN